MITPSHITQPPITPSTYVCELPTDTRFNLLVECVEALAHTPYPIDIAIEIDNVRRSKLSDIEELVDINKYVTKQEVVV